ncbi:ABC transporter permease [Rubrobacter indicoceani]|uniref:ABC transporter permease n=1 Tax=Rubrobacter indicoceani TaxID=2051957 RepID=UPI001F0926EE|nr:ABC transporter permease [Rubrobacter indicoceani]
MDNVSVGDDPPTAVLNLGLVLQDFFVAEEERAFIDWGWLRENFVDQILPSFFEHIVLCFVSLAIAIAISLPLGILAARYRPLYAPLTVVTGFLYTIPSFSFFTILLFVFGMSVGTAPAIIALVAYSLLILVRNVVTGLDSVPVETIDAARGMGLTDRQILWNVELPLALPVIVAGMRIAIVTVIGIAVLGAYIGAGGLGDPIFDGVSRQFPTLYVTGAVLATLLAIVSDRFFVVMERALSPWTKRARRV